jgi:AcrR family transcriptional regulator
VSGRRNAKETIHIERTTPHYEQVRMAAWVEDQEHTFLDSILNVSDLIYVKVCNVKRRSSPPRTRRRQAHFTGKRPPGRPRSEQAHEAILRSALVLLEDVGFQQLSVEAVADAAKVSKATVYRWWPNKAALVADAFATSSVEQLHFPDTGSVLTDINRQMKRVIELFLGPQGRMVSALIGGGQSDPELTQAFRERFMRPRREEAYEILQRAVARGELSADIDFDLLLDALYGPIYMRFLIGHRPLTQSFAKGLCELVLTPLLLSKGE